MKCDRLIENYMSLDAGERPGLFMRIHLFRCPNCRAEARRLDAVYRAVAEQGPLFVDRDMREIIMRSVKASGTVFGKKVSLLNWLSAEAIIVASLVLVQFSEPRIWLGERMGECFEFAISVSLGVIVTLFSALLVGAHMKELAGLRERFIARFLK